MGSVADHEIYVFSPDESINDYDTMGIVGALTPSKCIFKEHANGENSLELSHPLDIFGRYQALVAGNILVAPVPVRSTPEIKDGKIVTTVFKAAIKPTGQLSSKDQRTLYKNKAPVTKKGKTTDTKIKVLPGGHELVIVADYGDPAPARWKVKSAKYGTGWINPDGINVIETVLIDDNAQSIDEVQSPWSVRPQYFRIIEEHRTLTEINIKANHIRYDLLKNMTRFHSPKSISLTSALKNVLEETYDDHWFSFKTNISNQRAGLDYRRKNLVDVFLNPEEGICKKYNAALISDNYDLYFLHDPGRNRGIFIEYGKNMLGIDFVIDEDSVITHIVPVGETRDGEPLTLGMKVTYKKLTKKEKEEAKKNGTSTDPVEIIEYDSPDKDMVVSDIAHFYPLAHVYELKCEDCKVHDEEEGGGKVTLSVVKARMREQATALFQDGVDQPRFTMTIDYINLGDTEEYKQFYALESAFLWDYLIIRHYDLGIDVSARIIGIEWDVLTGKMIKTEIGQIGANLVNQGIANWQIPNGFPGWKIGAGTIPGVALQNGTISANHIQANSITAGHIQAGSIVTDHLESGIIDAGHINAGSINAGHIQADTIDAGHIKAGSIDAGHIKSGSIETNHLTAKLIDAEHINAGSINAGHIQSDTIETRHIKAGVLEAAIANIDLANIITANIETANIDWAAIIEANIVWADISTLNAQMAIIASAEIGNAKIDYGQIVNLVTDTALIEQGVSGKYVIKDLDVTENLTAVTIDVGDITVSGNLILTGSDGNLYSFKLDEYGETITPVVTRFTGENISDRSISANKLIANTITANELNVSSIFANEAFLMALSANTISAGDLIASNVFTQNVVSNIISNPEAIDIIAGAGIRLVVKNELSEMAREFAGKNLSLSFSRGTILGRDNTVTHVKATVRVNGVDINDKVPAQCFIWERLTPERVDKGSYDFMWNPTPLDLQWSIEHTGLKEFDITTDDIHFTGVIRCSIDISKGLPMMGLQEGNLLQMNPDAPVGDIFGVLGLQMTSSSDDYFISLDSVVYDDGYLVVRYRDIVPDPVEVTMTDRTDDPYDTEMKASITLTNERISLEANRVSNIDSRMEEAELLIKPEAIVSTVTSSTEYGNDKVYVGSTAPLNPVVNKLWVDVSVVDIPQYKRWTGSKWVIVTDASLMGRVDSHQTKIEQNAYDISLRATKTSVDGLDTRLKAAEIKVTDSQIVSTVTNSASWNVGIPYTGSSAPTNPPTNKQWIDTSTNPPQLKRWTGSAWIVITDAWLSSTRKTQIEQYDSRIVAKVEQQDFNTFKNQFTVNTSSLTLDPNKIVLSVQNGIVNNSQAITTSTAVFNNSGLTIKHTNIGTETRFSADGMRIYTGSTLIGGLMTPTGSSKVMLAANGLYDPRLVNNMRLELEYDSVGGTWAPFVGEYLSLSGYRGNVKTGHLFFYHSSSREVGLSSANGTNFISVGSSGIVLESSNESSVNGMVHLNGYRTRTFNDLQPNITNQTNLGAASLRWANIYSQTALNAASDRREKKDIRALNNMTRFIMNLEPVAYKWIENGHGREHYGLISQDVKKAMTKSGIDDFAGFLRCMKEDDAEYREDASEDEVLYGLRYEEFIAPLIAVCQDQQRLIDNLTDRIIKMEVVFKKEGL